MHLPDYDPPYLVFGLLQSIGNRLQVLGDGFYQEITAKQWFLLAALELFPDGPPTLGQLARAMGTSHQNAKQLALKLEAKGYVELLRDERDRRRCRVRATAQSKALCRVYQEKQSAFIGRLFAGCPPGQTQAALAVLRRVFDNMDQWEKESP